MGYITIRGNAEDRFVEKHSEFIGYICHVETNDEAVEFINKIKAMHRKATHYSPCHRADGGSPPFGSPPPASAGEPGSRRISAGSPPHR